MQTQLPAVDLQSYSARTFRLLLQSLSRPGLLNQLDLPPYPADSPEFRPGNGTPQPVNLYAAGAMLSLLDSEVTFGVIRAGEWQESTTGVARWLMLRCGAKYVPPPEAQFVLVSEGGSGQILAHLSPGTLLEPENAATLFYCVIKLSDQPQDLPGEIGLALSGPGIQSSTNLFVSGLDLAEIEKIVNSRRHYPLGLDVYLIDEQGRCAGLPRTTQLYRKER